LVIRLCTFIRRPRKSAQKNTIFAYVIERGTAATGPREAVGVRRIPALLLRALRKSHIAPEYDALQTLRALVCLFVTNAFRKIIAKRTDFHLYIQRAAPQPDHGPAR